MLGHVHTGGLDLSRDAENAQHLERHKENGRHGADPRDLGEEEGERGAGRVEVAAWWG